MPKALEHETIVSKLLTEDVISIEQAIRELQDITGIRLHRATVWRWARLGCNGTKLETFRVGRVQMTSKQAVTRFIHARSR